MNSTHHDALPSWVWLYFPVILYFGHYVVRLLAPYEFWDRYVMHELGFTEQATVFLLVLALIVGLRLVHQAYARRNWRPLTFFLVFCLGCIYFAGEEASWGQHWAGLTAPEDWAEINRKAETNLHNLDSFSWLFNTLPRSILLLAILVGGAILPLWRKSQGKSYPAGSLAAQVMPGTACVPAALIAPFASMPQRALEAFDLPVPWWMDITPSEVKELMIAAFLLIYIYSIWVRLKAPSNTAILTP